MKLFVKLLVLVVVLALLGPFFIKGPDGAPLWKVPATMSEIKQTAIRSVPQPLRETEVEVYRWQDASGQWHFGESPPEGVAFDVLSIDTTTNAVSVANPTPEEDQPTAPDEAGVIAESPYVAPALPLPDLAATKQLIEDAKALQTLSEQRLQEIDARSRQD